MAETTVSETDDEIVSSSLLVLSGDHPTHFPPGIAGTSSWKVTDDGRDTTSEVGEECQRMNMDQEEHVGATEDSEIDQLLLAASQDYEVASSREMEEDGSSPNHCEIHRFVAPVTSTTVEEAGVPPKTRTQTSWACGVV